MTWVAADTPRAQQVTKEMQGIEVTGVFEAVGFAGGYEM